MKKVKEMNRTLLELYIGFTCWGVVLWGVGAIFVSNQWYYAKSLWFGIVLGMISVTHMHRSLDRALSYESATATKMITRAYFFRYFMFALMLGFIMITEFMNPLIVFLAYMGMKVAAFLQPFTHKLCNKMFHETDPVPQPLSEEIPSEECTEDVRQ